LFCVFKFLFLGDSAATAMTPNSHSQTDGPEQSENEESRRESGKPVPDSKAALGLVLAGGMTDVDYRPSEEHRSSDRHPDWQYPFHRVSPNLLLTRSVHSDKSEDERQKPTFGGFVRSILFTHILPSLLMP
jgi:hypothetical protein